MSEEKDPQSDHNSKMTILYQLSKFRNASYGDHLQYCSQLSTLSTHTAAGSIEFVGHVDNILALVLTIRS